MDRSDEEIIKDIKSVLEKNVKDNVAMHGGIINFLSYEKGIVKLEMAGSCSGCAMSQKTLHEGVERMLKHYVPEVERVADYRDAIPKPGLDTPEGRAIKEILETRVNPSVAAHGGHISLIDVVGPRAYIRMEGGCQGCGMANATLKDGVEVEIKKEVPSIQQVLDVTDHAEGTNPYYQSA